MCRLPVKIDNVVKRKCPLARAGGGQRGAAKRTIPVGAAPLPKHFLSNIIFPVSCTRGPLLFQHHRTPLICDFSRFIATTTPHLGHAPSPVQRHSSQTTFFSPAVLPTAAPLLHCPQRHYQSESREHAAYRPQFSVPASHPLHSASAFAAAPLGLPDVTPESPLGSWACSSLLRSWHKYRGFTMWNHPGLPMEVPLASYCTWDGLCPWGAVSYFRKSTDIEIR